MKKIILITLTLFTTLIFANSHTIIKQNGEKLEVNYLSTKNNIVFYSLPGNSTINEISSFAVDKVIEKSTKNLILDNSKLDVSGKSGYQKVQFLENDQIAGLKQGIAIKTIIRKPKGQHHSEWNKQAKARLQRQAAEKGFPFVQITKQNDSKIEALTYNY